MNEAGFFDIISPASPPSVAEQLNLLPVLAGILVALLIATAIYGWIKSRPLRLAKKRLVALRTAYQNNQLDGRLAAYLMAFELRQVIRARHLNPVSVKNNSWTSLQRQLADLRYPAPNSENQRLEEVFNQALRWLKRPRC